MQPLKSTVQTRAKVRRQLPGWIDRWISIGIVSSDPEVRQRQRFVNLGVYAAILNNAAHALYNSWYDFDALFEINVYNLVLSLLIALTPLWNRVGEAAGAAFLVTIIIIGNYYVVMTIGISGGSLAYYTLAGAMFIIFGVRHWRLYLFFVAVAALIILLSTVFAPNEGPVLPDDRLFRRNFAGQILLNVLILNCVMVVYAMWARWKAEQELIDANERTRSLIARTLPAAVAERLEAQPGRRVADGYETLTVLVAQLDGFAGASRDFGPRETVDYLDRLYSDFDRLVVRFGADKIRAVGERYLVAGGLDREETKGAIAIGGLALEMIRSMAQRAEATGYPVRLRIGIHSSNAVAGVIGRERLSFDIWGRAVDYAQKLAEEDRFDGILVSAAFVELTEHVFIFEDVETSGAGADVQKLIALKPVDEPELPDIESDDDLDKLL